MNDRSTAIMIAILQSNTFSTSQWQQQPQQIQQREKFIEFLDPPQYKYIQPQQQLKTSTSTSQRFVSSSLVTFGFDPEDKPAQRHYIPEIATIPQSITAISSANAGIVPCFDEYLEYLNTIPTIYGWDHVTIAMILANVKVQIQKSCIWWHNPSLKDTSGRTVAMLLASKGIIPSEDWLHDVTLSTENNMTVAMMLASQGIIPPTYWEHDPVLHDNNGYTVAMYLIQHKIIPPQCWYYTCKHIINETVYITPAMLFAKNNMYIPKEWNHDPFICDSENGRTVAMFMAMHNTIPPPHWQHDVDLKSCNDETVAMIFANTGNIPPTYWEHDPWQTNEDAQTVAMLLAQNGVMPPSQWQHDPGYTDDCGDTVAHLLAMNRIIPPPQWQIRSGNKNKCGSTVSQILRLKLKKTNEELIEMGLNIDGAAKPIVNVNGELCMVCFDVIPLIMKTKCGHCICKECADKWDEHNGETVGQYGRCPYCKRVEYICM